MSSQPPHRTVFYSWQSDLPNRTNRTFIQDALQKAIDGILKTELEVDLILDRDTANTPGAPDIAQTILSKIDQAIAVVADVSIINSGSGERLAPNPNVLFELGYAVRALSWGNILPATVDVARIVFRGRDNTYPSGDILIDYELRAEGAPSLNSRMTINNEGAIS